MKFYAMALAGPPLNAPQKTNPLDWDLANLSQWASWGGVDEAGRGAWAGPVVAAAAVLTVEIAKKWENVLRQARDSKTLKPEKRSALAMELKVILPSWSVSAIDNQVIDRINILEAARAAMRQAICELKIQPDVVLIDGDHTPGSGLKERAMIDGDAYSCAIACASILAKTHRDAMMIAIDAQYPEYGFAHHKGYGTKEHQAALARRGPCPIHRVTYRPVKAKAIQL
jgi:ribonuclease HII